MRTGSSSSATAGSASSNGSSGSTASKRSRATKGSKKKKNPERDLPPHFETLLAAFVSLDIISCLLLKRQLPCTLERMKEFSKLAQFEVRVQEMLGLQWPQMATVRQIDLKARDDIFAPEYKGGAESALELNIGPFKKNTSQIAINKRRAAVRERLVADLEAAHDTFVSRFDEKAWPGAAEGVWHPDFDPAKVVLRLGDIPKITMEEGGQAGGGCLGAPSADNFDKRGLELGLDGILESIRKNSGYKDQIEHVEEIPSREADCSLPQPVLVEPVQAVLTTMGVARLYNHQTEAIHAIQRRKSCVVSTSTSSGKSLIFTLPVFETLVEDPQAVAIFMYPTKALAQDQLGSLRKKAASHPGLDSIVCNTYDGDTKATEREHVRLTSRIFLTNPDMLHYSILPGHSTWRAVLRHLRYVVIDEAHTYSGTFGAHVACILRRLRRLCMHHGNSRLQFIGCSATIANPEDHFRMLIGRSDEGRRKKDGMDGLDGDDVGSPACDEIVAVTKDSSPNGKKLFVFWNPPWVLEGSGENANTQDVSWGAARWLNQKRKKDQRHRQKRREERDAAVPGSPSPMPSPDASECSQPPSSPPSAKRARTEPPPDSPAKSARSGVSTTLSGISTLDRLFTSENPDDAMQLYEENRRRSSFTEASELMAEMVRHGLRTLVFCRARKVAEVVLKNTREIFDKQSAPQLSELIRAYRSGYLASERREIENGLFTGKLLGVAATNALELGVDIGTLDSTIQIGLPHTMASFWQQAGRSGRSGRDSMSILVAHETPVDQYFMRNPHSLLRRKIECAAADVTNPYVLRQHLLLAAQELALNEDTDSAIFGPAYDASLFELLIDKADAPVSGQVINGGIVRGVDGYRCSLPKERFSAKDVNIRSADSRRYQVIDQASGEVIDESEYHKAQFELFEGAIFLKQAQEYIVRSLDCVELEAKVQPCRPNYYTKCQDLTVINALTRLDGVAIPFKELHPQPVYSKATVKTYVYGYRRLAKHSGRVLEKCTLPKYPPAEMETVAVWCPIPDRVHRVLDDYGMDLWAGLHAIDHCLLELLPVFVSCDRADVGTECPSAYDVKRERPRRILIFDKQPGGCGVSAGVYKHLPQLLKAALDLINACKCGTTIGCPMCIQTPRCGEYNERLDKQAAIVLLECLLADSADANAQLPDKIPLVAVPTQTAGLTAHKVVDPQTEYLRRNEATRYRSTAPAPRAGPGE